MRAATLKESAHHATHMPDYQAIDVSRDGAVARIAFDRPDAYNTLDERMAEEMVTAAQRLVSDDDIRCLVVTGNGPVFNTGADLGELAGDGSDEQRLRSLAGSLHEFVGQLLRAPMPVVTGVNGVAAGGGLGPALCGDIVLAAESARFEFAYPRIGLSGDGGSTYILPRLVGLRQARWRWTPPVPASPSGPVAAVVEILVDQTEQRLLVLHPDEAFDERLTAEAERLAKGPTAAYAATRRLLLGSFEDSLETHLAEEAETIAGLTNTEDFSRGHAAFGGDDEPEFVGE